jgi:hypothetical protein
MIRDGELRRALICNGLIAARKQSLERFTQTILRELNTRAPAGKTVMAHE